MKRTPSATAIAGAVEASSIQMPQSGDYSLYFHIPFCTKKCDYCHFYVIPDQAKHRDLYLEALKKEWDQRYPLLPSNRPVSIFFGGGTPSLLPHEAIASILDWISPDADCEITLEANPENVTLERMRGFNTAGINRISLGVQTLDETLLTTLSRTHKSKQALNSVNACYEAGFENITIDLMYDLPGQTLESWNQTLQLATALPITHLSLYNLTIEPHTVFYKKRASLKLPDSETSLAMLKSAVETLQSQGFERYEISAFAKEGKYSRHNTGYWTGRPFLGFGPSACSYWNGSRFRNVPNLNKYAKSLNSGTDPADFSETLSPKEKLKESLAVGLRLTQGIPKQTWPITIEKGLERLQALGLLEFTTQMIRLTEKGFLFHDTVAEEIMDF